MKSTQGWAWLAAGVMALGLNGIYQDGGAAWAHQAVDTAIARFADRSGAVLALATGRADRFFASVNLGAARDEATSCKLAAVVTRIQDRMLHRQSGIAQFEEMSAREQAALARFEAHRARMEAQLARVAMAPVAFHLAEIPVVTCPRVRVNVPRVSTPKIPIVRISPPAVRLDGLGAGPV